MENFSGKNYKIARVVSEKSPNDLKALGIMEKEINKVGGLLHFVIEKSEDGWSAQCEEIKGIITGGINSDPNDDEIQSQISEAIYAAFNISNNVPSESIIKNTAEIRTFALLQHA